MLKKLFFILFAALSLAALTACAPDEVAYNSNSGFNGTRDSASQLEIDKNVSEDLNAAIGDNEDWYFFTPKEAGTAKVSAFFDSPAALEGTVNIYDGFGRPLQSFNINKAQNIQESAPFEVTAERYFIALKLNAGQSNYSVRVDFKLPEPPAIEIEETVATNDTPSSGHHTKPSKKPTTDAAGIPEGAKTLKGTIVLVTPREGDVSDIKISGFGSQNGIKPGMKAYLRGLNRKVDIYACKNTFCNATIKANSEELARYNTVDVVVE